MKPRQGIPILVGLGLSLLLQGVASGGEVAFLQPTFRIVVK